MEPDWRHNAECAGLDPDLFHSSDTATALKVCAVCPVRTDCLRDALEAEASLPLGDVYGIRGGMTPRARREIQRERRSGPLTTVIPHGTIEGYARCWRRNGGSCIACRDAYTRWSNPTNTTTGTGTRSEFTTLAARLKAVC